MDKHGIAENFHTGQKDFVQGFLAVQSFLQFPVPFFIDFKSFLNQVENFQKVCPVYDLEDGAVFREKAGIGSAHNDEGDFPVIRKLFVYTA